MSISRTWRCSNTKPVFLMLALLTHARAATKEQDKDSGTIKDYLIMALVVIAIALVLLAVILLMRGLKMCRCFNCYCLNRSYKRYCRQHSTPNTTIMPEQEFERRKDALVEAINSTKSRNGQNFTFQLEGATVKTIASVKAIKVQPFQYELHLDGEDEMGSYEGRGGIITTKKDMLLWFFKDYDNRFKAYGRNIFDDLLFQSTQISSSGATGKWKFYGHQGGDSWRLDYGPAIQTEARLQP